MHHRHSKWIVRILCSLLLLVVLAACGGDEESSPPPADESSQQEAASVEETATPTEEPTATPVPPTATPEPPTPTPEPTATPTPEPLPEESMEDSSGLPLPVPEDAQDALFESTEITFVSPSDIETLVTFYRDALAVDGWEEQADFSQVDETFAFVEFDRGDEYIFITIFEFDGNSEASIDLSSAPSLAGDAATASTTGSGYTIADWPTPPDATDVNLSGDLLAFKVVMPLVDLVEFYRPTFEMMELGTSCLDDVEEFTSLSCSSSNGEATLNFFAFEGSDATEVEIDFVNNAFGPSPDSDQGVTEVDGLPLPEDNTGYASEGTEFSQKVYVSSPSDVETLLAFYQAELPDRGWTLDETDQTAEVATLRLSGPDGELVVTLTAGDETEILLSYRNVAAAEEAGVIPPAGQARIYLVNFSDGELSVTINDQTFTLAPEEGMESPDDAPNLDLPPGTYQVTTEVAGSSVTDEVTVGADESWGLLLDAQGALPLQIY